jgi:hypothetical protein
VVLCECFVVRSCELFLVSVLPFVCEKEGMVDGVLAVALQDVKGMGESGSDRTGGYIRLTLDISNLEPGPVSLSV